jgi:hypothetical protein
MLSRRDLRTEPGVSTPGEIQIEDRPVGAADKLFLKSGATIDVLPLLSGPFRADRLFASVPAVKTPGYLGLNPRLSPFIPSG